MPTFIKARLYSRKTKSVLYIDDAGDLTLRVGGTRPWRDTNPGSLDYTPFSIRHGAIGTDGRLAIFPDYDTGKAALSALLHGDSYVNMSIFDAIAKYAPPEENDTAAYRKQIADYTGLDITRILNTLNNDEFNAVLLAVQRIEGYNVEGEIRPLPKVNETKKDKKGDLSEFLLEGNDDFIPLSATLELARNEMVYAVAVSSSDGDYIRAFPDDTIADNFDSIAEDEDPT